MFVTRVTRKGQTTIPAGLREKMGLEEHDEVVWFAGAEGLLLKKKQSVKNPLGVLLSVNLKSKKSALELTQEAEGEFW